MANMSEGNPAPAAIASVPGSVDNSARQARANAASAGIRRQANKFDNYADILLDAKPYNSSKFDLPTSPFTKGQYLPRNEEMDRRLAAWFSLPEGGSQSEDGQVMNWGQKTQPTELLLDYAESKYAQAEYRALLDLGSLLIDPTDPRSQEQAFAIMPEMRDVPRERSVKIYKMHFMLEAILRTGTITSQEELFFIYQLLNPKSQIPLLPTWMELVTSSYSDNPAGDLRATVLLTNDGSPMNEDNATLKGRQYRNGNTTPYSIFDPWTHTLAPQAGDKAMDAQLRIKFVIMRRLFPAIRKADASDGYLEKLLNTIYDRNQDGVALIKQLSQGASVNSLFNAEAWSIGSGMRTQMETVQDGIPFRRNN